MMRPRFPCIRPFTWVPLCIGPILQCGWLSKRASRAEMALSLSLSVRYPLVDPGHRTARSQVDDGSLAVIAAEDEGGVRAAEAEGIRQDRIDPGVVDALAHDVHVGEGRVDLLDMSALADEAVVHHQQRVDRLLHPRRAQGVAREGFGRRDRRAFFAGAGKPPARLHPLL